MSGLTKEQLEARGLVLAGMVDQEATIASLRAENERLREALEGICRVAKPLRRIVEHARWRTARLTFANAEACAGSVEMMSPAEAAAITEEPN